VMISLSNVVSDEWISGHEIHGKGYWGLVGQCN
jgi:hypothetical protein